MLVRIQSLTPTVKDKAMKLTILSTTGVNKQYAEHIGYDELINLVDEALPMYTPEAEEVASMELVKQIDTLYKRVLDADQLQFFQPQYNGSLPPITLNFIAWLSRRNTLIAEDGNWRDAFKEKNVHIYSYSAGTSANMVSHFEGLLGYFGAGEVEITTTTSREFV
jgi:NAD(P)H-dependent FMN reductase